MKKKKGRQKVSADNWERQHDRQLSSTPQYEYEARDADSPIGDPNVVPNALLLAYSGQWAWVQHEGEERLCRVDERSIERHSAALAAGDAVRVEWEGTDPMVRGVAPRRTKLSRRMPNGREQIVAANIDALLIVTAPLQPRFKAGVVDRYLIAAEVGGIEPIICLNKVDLTDKEPEAIHAYRELGMSVVRTSCATGEGLDELRELLRGKLTVLAGQSGVGKSSLINALDPEMDIVVQTVSRFNDKGRHTTRRARLHELQGGTRIIDTPGVRQMAVHGLEAQEVDLYFPEIAELATSCRFRDCRHQSEPGCAILAAVESGDLPAIRYKSYLRIHDSLSES
ncbi:MAG: ribosome small subunit-dependent GTPase A [FCB group bacterium]|nr:ribosome small subunit-dependent GTPase A [FCB group bacterium]